jgi:benzodiazapine receptor
MGIPNFLKLIISLAAPLLAGFLGSIFTFKSVSDWYPKLKKPFFNPPNWIFGPVWTLLYLLMGLALYLVWKEADNSSKLNSALLIFSFQLLLNILWSLIFFGLKIPFIAFGEIILLWLAILQTIINFMTVSKNAGLLLIPYLIWVSFATLLNGAILWLNY